MVACSKSVSIWTRQSSFTGVKMSVAHGNPEQVHDFPAVRGHIEGIHQRFKRIKLCHPETGVANVQPMIDNVSGTETLHTSTMCQDRHAPRHISELPHASSNTPGAALEAASAPHEVKSTEGKQIEYVLPLGSERLQHPTATGEDDLGSHVLPLRDVLMSSSSKAFLQQSPVRHQVQLDLSRQASAQHLNESQYFPGVPAPPKSALTVPDVAIRSLTAGLQEQHTTAAHTSGEAKHAQNRDSQRCCHSVDPAVIHTLQTIVHNPNVRGVHALPSSTLRRQQYGHAASGMSHHSLRQSEIPNESSPCLVGLHHGLTSKDLPWHLFKPHVQHQNIAGRPGWPHDLASLSRPQGQSAQLLHRAVNSKIGPQCRPNVAWSSQHLHQIGTH